MLLLLGFGCLALGVLMKSSPFLWDFMIALIQFTFHIICILMSFGQDILNEVISIAVKVSPALWHFCRVLVGFAGWMMKQLVKGIFGTGCQFLSALSWVFLMSACVLYLGNIFQLSATHTSPEEENNQNARREVDQEERREVLENEENENEENSNEEAEINLAIDDNDRNRVREIEQRVQQNDTAVKEMPGNLAQRPASTRNNQLYVRLPERNVGSSSESDPESDENQINAVRQRNQQILQRNLTFRRRCRHTQCNVNLMCIVCMEHERSIAVFPCGHLQLCHICIDRIMRNNGLCPLCQSHIDEHRKVFL